MKCPNCGAVGTQVKDSRPSMDDATIRRRRLCTSCGANSITVEITVGERLNHAEGAAHGSYGGPGAHRTTEVFHLIAGLSEEDADIAVSLVRRLSSAGPAPATAAPISRYALPRHDA